MKRMKRRYKHMLIRSILLLLLFLAAVVAAFFVSHRETPGEAVVMEMEDAVLPVVEASVDGNYLNTMHGYTAEMVDRYMRDTVTPLPEDRKLPIRIIWKNDPVKKVRFEVRSLDTTQLVEDTAVDFQKSADNRTDSGVIELELPIQNLLEKGKEYQLKIILQTGHFEQVAYYTRIVLSDSLPVGEMIRFIQNFHTKTLTAEKASGFAVYLKTNTDTTGSLGKVTLNSCCGITFIPNRLGKEGFLLRISIIPSARFEWIPEYRSKEKMNDPIYVMYRRYLLYSIPTVSGMFLIMKER